MGFKQGPCLTENIHQIIVPQSCHRQQMDQFRYQDYHHETSGSIPSARPGPSHWVSGGKHFQFREKLRSVTVFWREEKSGLNFSAAPSQLDSEEASKDFSREVDILVVEFYSQQSRHIPSSATGPARSSFAKKVVNFDFRLPNYLPEEMCLRSSESLIGS